MFVEKRFWPLRFRINLIRHSIQCRLVFALAEFLTFVCFARVSPSSSSVAVPCSSFFFYFLFFTDFYPLLLPLSITCVTKFVRIELFGGKRKELRRSTWNCQENCHTHTKCDVCWFVSKHTHTHTKAHQARNPTLASALLSVQSYTNDNHKCDCPCFSVNFNLF